MPGAPNRPPEVERPPAPELPADQAARRVLRRLAPMRVALRLDLWKGAPSPELLAPLEHAERNFESKDYATASGHLDQLAVRFAEPRWPTLPKPFKDLRQHIPAPQPPHWDPEHGLSPTEKEQRLSRRALELQQQLATATVDWARGHGIAVEALEAHLSAASAALATDEARFWEELDRFWQGVRAHVPMPTRRTAAAGPAASS